MRFHTLGKPDQIDCCLVANATGRRHRQSAREQSNLTREALIEVIGDRQRGGVDVVDCRTAVEL